jgi:hypothetical protein
VRTKVSAAEAIPGPKGRCRTGQRLNFSETMKKPSSAPDESFAPTLQFVKLEIHKVFLRFPNFNLSQNLSPSAIADFLIASLEGERYIWKLGSPL